MCYDAESLELYSLRIAAHRSQDEAEREALRRKLDELSPLHKKYYHVSGFEHPNFLVFTNERPLEPRLFHWGLIPSWIKDVKSAASIVNQTVNARGETLFEKPAFKAAALRRRCLVYIDAFYEHHHYNNKTYPFRICMKDDAPMALAGLWEEWPNPETGEIIKTFTIVTTVGNPLLTRIHNNPKAMGPRMPVILPREKQDEWLLPVNSEVDKSRLMELIQPFDESLMKAHPVGRLKGKAALGNIPQVREEAIYPELNWC